MKVKTADLERQRRFINGCFNGSQGYKGDVFRNKNDVSRKHNRRCPKYFPLLKKLRGGLAVHVFPDLSLRQEAVLNSRVVYINSFFAF